MSGLPGIVRPLTREQLRSLANLKRFGGCLKRLRDDLRLRWSIAMRCGGGIVWVEPGNGRERVRADRVALIEADLRVLETMCLEEGITG